LAPSPPRSPRRNIDEVIAAAELSLAEEAAAAAASGSQNAFALALQALLSRPRLNLFYSPLSIRMALAMTYAGARGTTANEMREALCASTPEESLHGELAATIRRFNTSPGAVCELAIANSMWTQEGAGVLPSFAELTTQRYGATVRAVDFRREPSEARKTINEWVGARTNHRVPELLKPPLPAPDTRLILADAVCFKGAWRRPFERERTSESPFYLEDGTAVPTPLMHDVTDAGYTKGAGYQAVLLPYVGTTLAMMVLLPDRRDGLPDLERALTPQVFAELTGPARTTEVEVFLPRFRITWDGELVETLRQLGMQRAFTREADFSAINGHTPPDEEALFVSTVLHSAFCEVNEQGTEAAAATAALALCAGIWETRQPPPVFRADHPFLFAIVDAGSGAIVFLGRVLDPTRET
jgi:serpin B